MTPPLVTVVCVCYNHERFVEEALNSLIQQTYKNLQIIVVDDASKDASVEKIRGVDIKDRNVEFVFHESNQGYCRAFNRVLTKIKGEYFIDFAADDVMMPDRIEKQVRKFESLDGSYGVVFTDAAAVGLGVDALHEALDPATFFTVGMVDVDDPRREEWS